MWHSRSKYISMFAHYREEWLGLRPSTARPLSLSPSLSISRFSGKCRNGAEKTFVALLRAGWRSEREKPSAFRLARSATVSLGVHEHPCLIVPGPAQDGDCRRIPQLRANFVSATPRTCKRPCAASLCPEVVWACLGRPLSWRCLRSDF